MPGNLPVPPISVTSQWPTPNYIDPIRRNWMPAYAGTIHMVGTILVFMRFWLRTRRIGGGFGLDDALLFPSWLLSTALVALAIYSSRHGLIDRHIWDVPASKLPSEALNAWIASFVFLLGSCFVKLSILLFYRRLQAKTYNPRWRFAIHAAMLFTVLYTLGLILALIFNCNPTQAYWKAYDPAWTREYHCVDTVAVSVLAGVLSIVSDAYSVALPCVMLNGLKISRRQKMGLNVVFLVGSVVVGAGIARTYEFHRLTREWDTTWVGFSVYVWSLLEYELGIICACAPSLRVFVKSYIWDKVNCRMVRQWIGSKQPGASTNLRTSKRTGHRSTTDQLEAGSDFHEKDMFDPEAFSGLGAGSNTTTIWHQPYMSDGEEAVPVKSKRETEFKIPPGVWARPTVRGEDEAVPKTSRKRGRELMGPVEFFLAEKRMRDLQEMS